MPRSSGKYNDDGHNYIKYALNTMKDEGDEFVNNDTIQC